MVKKNKKMSRRSKKRTIRSNNLYRTRKMSKTGGLKSVGRKHKSSTAGKILPPLDVRSSNHLKEFEKRIKNGNLTIILVWAEWCPHCHTMMPHFDSAAKSPGRSIQAVKVEEKMLPAVNQVLTSNVNKSAKPINVEGYPSIILVDKEGNKVTDIEPVRDTDSMKKLMENAGPLMASSKLVNANSVNSDTVTPNSVNKANVNQRLLSNLGKEEEGLSSAPTRNIDMGEEELKGSIVASMPSNASIKPVKENNKANNKNRINQKQPNGKPLNEKPINEKSINETPINEIPLNETPLNENPLNEKPNIVAPPANIKKLSDEVNEITSLTAPLTPPSIGTDLEENVSISNNLTPEQKLSGGSRYKNSQGGSLYSAMAKTTYTIAPAAALLATAALVMKGKPRKTRKNKRGLKTRSRRA